MEHISAATGFVESKKSASGIYRKTHKRHASVRAKGLVSWEIHGPTKQAPRTFTPSDIVEIVKTGLPLTELEDLRGDLDLPMEKLAAKVGLSKTTLHRRKDTGRLDTHASDRVLRFARLLGKATEVMGSLKEGRKWLMSEQFGLGGAVPLDYASTEVGAREVDNLLTRIYHGVYS